MTRHQWYPEVIEEQPPHRVRVVLVITWQPDKPPLRIRVWGRPDQGGRQVEMGPSDEPPAWVGGLTQADFRWEAGDDDPPDLVLSWHALPPDAPFAWAEVDDVVKLASDSVAQRAVKEFYVALARLGRPRGGGLTVEAIVAAVADHYAARGTWPTQDEVAESLAYSPDRVRQVTREAGGWEAIRARATGT
jgi:hypothetical protein